MLKQFFNDQDGQTTVEYLLIIAVVVVVISVLGNQLRTRIGGVVDKVFGGVGSKIDQMMGASNGN